MNTMLTETWAAAYFQSLIMVLVFLLGVPALLLQLVAPSVDLYRLVQRRFRLSRVAYTILILAVSGTVAFAWFVHPDNSPWPASALIVANLSISTAVLGAGAAWMFYLRRFTRRGISGQIEASILGRFRAHGERHEPAERALELLGEASKPGPEKADVLARAGRAIDAALDCSSYDGTLLTGIVQVVRNTLLAPGNQGNSENFHTGCDLLHRTASRIASVKGPAAAAKYEASSDRLFIHAAIADIACAGAAAGHRVQLHLIEVVSAERVLEIGVVAWRHGFVPVYTSAANQLNKRSHSSDPPLTGDALLCLLALLAHLGSGGPSAREWSTVRLRNLHRRLGKESFLVAIEASRKNRYDVGDFASADALKNLLSTMEPLPETTRPIRRRKQSRWPRVTPRPIRAARTRPAAATTPSKVASASAPTWQPPSTPVDTPVLAGL